MSAASPAEARFGSIGLNSVQRRRRMALLCAGLAVGLVFPFVTTAWQEEGIAAELAEALGMMMVVAAVIGRGWCTLYIGGRKSQEIVATGPYSVSRNPLYLFSLIGIAGIGAMAGSVVLALLLTGIAVAVFLPVILLEEKALAERFGADYAAYRARVPRFGPRISAWRDADILVASPRLYWRTLRDASVFLLAIPLYEAIEWLREGGHLITLLRLP